MPAELASGWLRQTPFFTFPVHYDCYGNVLLQLSGAKRAVLTHRRYVKKTTSHEIFDVPRVRCGRGRSSGLRRLSDFPTF